MLEPCIHFEKTCKKLINLDPVVCLWKVRVTGLGIKEASTKSFPSEDGSQLTTLCQTQSDSHKLVMFCLNMNYNFKKKVLLFLNANSTDHKMCHDSGSLGENSVHKGQGHKPLLDAPDLGAQAWKTIMPPWLIWPCGLKITLENCFYSTQSVAASRNVLRKEETIYQLCTDTLLRSLNVSSSQMDKRTVDMCSVIRWVHVSAAFEKKTKKHDKDNTDNPGCYKSHVQNSTFVTVWQCISANGMSDFMSTYVWRCHWCWGMNFGAICYHQGKVLFRS